MPGKVNLLNSDSALDFGRIPPQALQSEEAVLAAIMVNPDVIDDVLTILTEVMFYKHAHERIYAGIMALHNQNKPPDIISLTEYLKSEGTLDEVGGPIYLVEISSTVVTGRFVENHANIVKEMYLRREYIRISHEISTQSFDGSFSFDELSQKAEQAFFDVSSQTTSTDPEPISVIFERTLAEIKRIEEMDVELIGVPSGLTSLDRITLGWQKTDLILIAARPSMGKTAFSLFCSRNAAELNNTVMFFSLEMSKNQLSYRLLVNEYNTSTELKTGSKIEWTSLVKDAEKDYTKRLIIDDTPAISVMEMRSTVRRQKKRGPVDLVVVDYLQLAQGDPELKGSGDRYIGSISAGLKSMAKELDVPVIALSQLNRAVESRPNPMPVLSDLRESGNLEQDADIIVFLTRLSRLPEKYHTDVEGNDVKGKAYIDVAKNRNGLCDRLKVNVTEDAMNWGFTDVDLVF